MDKAVLLFGNYPPPYGGVPTHIQYLGRYLVHRGWDVHVLSFSTNRRSVERIDGCTVYTPTLLDRWPRLLAPTSADLGRLRRFGGLARGEPKNYLAWSATANLVRQIVRRNRVQAISAYHVLGAGVSSAWICEEFGLPLITTVFGEIYARPEHHRQRLAEVRYVVERSSKLLSCSRHCADSYRVLGLDPEVETLYYGIDTERFTPTAAPPGAQRVIYCGRMVREMGLHILLESIPLVLARRPNTIFDIVGRAGDLTASATRLQAAHPRNILLLPDAPNQALAGRYAAASLAVAPSINERACLGLALAEAMASGKATIGCRVGGTAEVVVEGETGLLVPPGDPPALAEAIVGLLDSPDAMAHMGRAGRQRALALFDKDATNQRMEQILEEVLS